MDIPFSKKSFFNALTPKQAFVFGIVTALLVLGTIGCVVLGVYVWRGGSSRLGADTAANTAATNTATTAPVTASVSGTLAPITADDHITGSGDITIITYSDFQCPYCKSFDTTMQQVMAEYAGRVKWVYRHYPLSFHANAAAAAEAAECAGEQDKFWEYAAKLFENQKTLGDTTYTSIATELGLNVSDFSACLSSDRMLAAVQEDQVGASAVGVKGTPSSFLISQDGTVANIKGGAVKLATLKALLDQELAK
jgi:protein-disulfide isomerase